MTHHKGPASSAGHCPAYANSVRSANQSARRFIPFNGSFCRGTMGKLAGRQNTCERDISRNRACTTVQGRFCNPPGTQVGARRATCTQHRLQNTLIVNYLNIFTSHMFYRHRIQSHKSGSPHPVSVDTILQSTFMSKPRYRALQGTSAAKVEGKGAHLQHRTPSHGLQTAITRNGELQNRAT